MNDHGEVTEKQFDRALSYALRKVGREGSPEDLPEPLCTVIRVHAAQGVIDNGGLQFFFESDFHGQPPYSDFIEAYRAIGANDAADDLQSAVNLFPFDEPHKHDDLRNEFLERFQGNEEDDEIEAPYSPFEPYDDALCGNEDVWRLLKKYVAQHRQFFGL